ncbi:PepSY domain-containing protein [Nonomuraea terrae]|uniref:PepSY domain-containing protein n=1 Tax=Nonomuraea terrae TaxID=2530383 RepID=UPI0037AE4164
MNKTIIGSLVGAAVLAGGCATVQGEADRAAERAGDHAAGSAAVRYTPTVGTPTAFPPGTPAPTDAPPPSPGRVGAADVKQAGEIARRAVPGSTVMAMETEENGRRWEVQLAGRDGAEHQVDVESGQVVSGPVAEDGDPEDKAQHLRLLRAAKLDYAQAADKVMATVPEGRITELSLDFEQNKAVWESDVVTPDGAAHDVAIDAATGAVIRTNRPTT